MEVGTDRSGGPLLHCPALVVLDGWMHRLAGEAQAARQPNIRDCIFGIQV